MQARPSEPKAEFSGGRDMNSIKRPPGGIGVSVHRNRLWMFSVAAPVVGSVAAVVGAIAIGPLSVAAADDGTETTTDQLFIKALNDKGIHMAHDGAVTLAHSTCSQLEQGGSLRDTLFNIKNSSALSDGNTVVFDGIAVYVYCQQYFPEVRAAAVDGAL